VAFVFVMAAMAIALVNLVLVRIHGGVRDAVRTAVSGVLAVAGHHGRGCRVRIAVGEVIAEHHDLRGF
jgi:hypothetical protein